MKILKKSEQELVRLWKMDPSLIDGISGIIGTKKWTTTNWAKIFGQNSRLFLSLVFSSIKYLPFVFLEHTKSFIGLSQIPSTGVLGAINSIIQSGLSPLSRGLASLSGGYIGSVSGLVQVTALVFMVNSLYKWKIQSWDPHRKRNRLYNRVSNFVTISQNLLRSLKKIDEKLKYAIPSYTTTLKTASIVSSFSNRSGKLKSYIKNLSQRSNIYDPLLIKKQRQLNYLI